MDARAPCAEVIRIEHAAASAEVSRENINWGEHNQLTAHYARILDQAAAVLRVHTVDLPAEHERSMPVDSTRAAHFHPSQFRVPVSPAGNGVSDVEHVTVLYVA